MVYGWPRRSSTSASIRSARSHTSAVPSEFPRTVPRPDADADPRHPYAGLLAAYLRRTAGAFDNAQTSQQAAEVIVNAATTDQPRFRWQTSAQAEQFVGLSLADLDGSRVVGTTSTWIA